MRIDEHIKILNEAQYVLDKIELQLIVFKDERHWMQIFYDFKEYFKYVECQKDAFNALAELKKLRNEYISIINKLK